MEIGNLYEVIEREYIGRPLHAIIEITSIKTTSNTLFNNTEFKAKTVSVLNKNDNYDIAETWTNNEMSLNSLFFVTHLGHIKNFPEYTL